MLVIKLVKENSMKKEFVPYPLAIKLKALGFAEPCLGYYDGNYNFSFMFEGKPEIFSYKKFPLGHSVGWTSAPTFSQAFRWFRDNHYAFHEVFIDCEPKMGVPLEEDLMFSFTIHLLKEDKLVCGPRDTYQTQEEAELACIEKLIEIVEKK